MNPQPVSSPLGRVSMVLGIVALPLVFCYALGLPAGIAAVVLGILALRRDLAASRTPAVTGIICGAVAVLAMVVVIALPDS